MAAKIDCQEIRTSNNIDTFELFEEFRKGPLNTAAEIGMVKLLGL